MTVSKLTRCCCLLLAAGALCFISIARGAEEFVPPSPGEREAVAALVAKGAIVRVDGSYRVNNIVLNSNCTNDDLKLVGACERLTSLQVSSPQITDVGLEQLKALPVSVIITVSRSGLSEAAIASLRERTPSVRILNFGPAPGTTATSRGGPPIATGPGGFGNRSFGPVGIANLATNSAVQDDLKLTTEQRQQVRAAGDLGEFMRSREAKVSALLTPEQNSRLKQLELQQASVTALGREEIAKELKLTDDQRSAVNNALREAAAGLNEATAFRGGPQSADAAAKSREKAADLIRQRDEKVLSLLNDDQRKAWLALQGPKGPDFSTIPTGGFGTALSPADTARRVLGIVDRDNDGSITQSEFETIPPTTRQRLTNAGVTFTFPVSREDFEKGCAKYLEERTRQPTPR